MLLLRLLLLYGFNKWLLYGASTARVTGALQRSKPNIDPVSPNF
jgi:hypothetical protein